MPLTRLAEALTKWADSHRLLLFDDSVLLGLRCGAPCASILYGVPCQWIAIGKLFGFSGVLQNLDACHHGGYDRDCEMLNGYITCCISPLEIVRCRAALQAIAKRKLCRNAAIVGRILRDRLRAQGLDCWGIGLALWHDAESGGLQNACALHDRLLPPLTLSRSEAEQIVVRTGLYSHLPPLFNSALGRMRVDNPPPFTKASEVIKWHAERIAALEQPRACWQGFLRPAVRRKVAWGQI